MKSIKKTVALVTCLFTSTLFAAEAPYSENQKKVYIAGFLAGAQITDRAIIDRLDKESNGQQTSGFMQRVYKTRLGDRNTAPPATYYAGFCLPDDTINENIIENILTEIDRHDSKSSADMASAVFKAIRLKFPC